MERIIFFGEKTMETKSAWVVDTVYMGNDCWNGVDELFETEEAAVEAAEAWLFWLTQHEREKSTVLVYEMQVGVNA
tara:strand:+ start:141 stop:368 length:228 start_codon:yes stop_codon:yes gene_type:complete